MSSSLGEVLAGWQTVLRAGGRARTGVPEGQRIEAIVLNSNLASTFAEIAGIAPPQFVDGRSFLPLLETPEQAWRESFLVERRQFEAQYVELAERQGLALGGLDQTAQFDAIRTSDWIYVEYGTGERELYDLARDRTSSTTWSRPRIRRW